MTNSCSSWRVRHQSARRRSLFAPRAPTGLGLYVFPTAADRPYASAGAGLTNIRADHDRRQMVANDPTFAPSTYGASWTMTYSFHPRARRVRSIQSLYPIAARPLRAARAGHVRPSTDGGGGVSRRMSGVGGIARLVTSYALLPHRRAGTSWPCATTSPATSPAPPTSWRT